MTIEELKSLLKYVHENEGEILSRRLELVRSLCGEEFEGNLYIIGYSHYSTVTKRIMIKIMNSNRGDIYLIFTPCYTSIQISPKVDNTHNTYLSGIDLAISNRFEISKVVELVHSDTLWMVLKDPHIHPFIKRWLKSKSQKRLYNIVAKYLLTRE